jgi:hypothetical protein
MAAINVLAHFAPLWQRYRFKVGFSGRGSAKSFHFGCALTNIASRAPTRAVCLREYQNSIADSSKAQIEEIIDLSGTRKAWNISRQYIEHKVTGSIITFKGLQNPEALKSATNFDVAFFEECETMTQDSLNIMEPTFRKNGSQLWFAGNPRDRMAPVAQYFIENTPPPSTTIITNSYLDNRYCPQTLIDSANHMKATNLALYNHIYLGQYLDTSNLILVNNVRRGGYEEQYSPKVVMGIDIAKDGGDKTVFCVRKGRHIVALIEHASMDRDNLIHQLQALIRAYHPERINIDSTGHGAWVPELLSAYGIEARGINFASNAPGVHESKVSNMRTHMYNLATEYFSKGGCIRPTDINLEKQLAAAYYTLDNKNRIKLLPKEEIRRRIGCSPDQADAFCLSLICDGDMFTSTKHDDDLQAQYDMISLEHAGMFYTNPR